MNKLLPVLVLVLILGGGYYVMNRQTTEAPAGNAMPEPPASGVTEMVVEESLLSPGETKTEKEVDQQVTVEGSPFQFSVKEIRVKKGDTVEITFVNKEGMHDWVLDEFNAKTKQIKAGESDTVTFVADKTGAFEYYCSVGSHRANGMAGQLIVE